MWRLILFVGLTAGCPGSDDDVVMCSDRTEPSDDPSSALEIRVGGESVTSLALAPEDEDWFLVPLCTAGGAQPITAELTVEPTLLDASGDIGIWLYAEGDTAAPLATSQGETVTLTDDWADGSAAERVLVRVFHQDGGSCSGYDISFLTSCSCQEDTLEPNDDQSSATSLFRSSESTTAVLQSVSGTSANDWFATRICPFEDLIVEATFPKLTDSTAALDAFFFYDSVERSPYSVRTSRTPPEGKTVLGGDPDGLLPVNESETAEEVLLRLSPGPGLCAEYDLSLTSRQILDDTADANDQGDDRASAIARTLPTCPNLDSIDPADVTPLERAYSVDADEDWYAFSPTAGGELQIHFGELRSAAASEQDGNIDLFVYRGNDMTPVAVDEDVLGMALTDGAQISVDPAEDETYYLQVRQASGRGCIKYELQFCEDPTPVQSCGFNPAGSVSLLTLDGETMYPECQFVERPPSVRCPVMHWRTFTGVAYSLNGEEFMDGDCGLGPVDDVMMAETTLTERQGCRLINDYRMFCLRD